MADPKNPSDSNDAATAAIMKRLREQELIQLKEIQREQEKLTKKADEYLEIQKKGGDVKHTIQEALLKEFEIQDKIISLEKDKIQIELRNLSINKEQNEEAIKQLETQLENLESLEKEYGIRKDIAVETNKFGTSVASSFSNITGIGGQAKSLLGSMIQIAGKGGSFKDSLKEAGQQIAKTLTPANLLAAVADKLVALFKKIIDLTIQLAIEQDKAYADFEKEVGNVDKYKDSIMNLRNTTGAYGVTVTDAAKAFSGFKQSFAGFESMSLAQREALAGTTAQLDKLGIAQADVIKTQEILIKGMGMSVKQSTDLQKSLYATANAMGIPPKQVAADFAKSAPQLSAHGKNMTKVFLDLQNNAKNTGIEFNRLLAITSKFDTFEGAADSAGQLNAILGGDYLNSIELLNASEGERVKIMQDSLKASGKSIEMLSKQEQMAMAQALGLSDVSELQKMMNNETAKGTVESIRAEQAQKEMNKAIEDATELGNAFKALLSKLAIEMRPVIEAIKKVVMGITSFLDEHPKLSSALGYIILGIGILGTVLIGAVTILIAVASALASLNTIAAATAPAAASAASGAAPMAAAITTVGQAATASSAGLGMLALVILAVGASFLMIGAGIMLAAMGMAELVKSFAGLGEAAWPAAAALIAFSVAAYLMIPALIGLATAVLGMGTAVTNPIALAAIGVLLSIGAAALMIGAGVGIAAAGLGYMAKSVSELFNSLSKADPVNIAKSFDALFDSLSLTGIAEFASFAVAANRVSSAMADLNKNLASVVASMKELDKVSANPKVNFSAGTVPGATVSPSVSTSTTAAKTASTSSTASTSNVVPVAIYIDSKKIGEILDPRYKQMIQDSIRNIGGKTVPV